MSRKTKIILAACIAAVLAAAFTVGTLFGFLDSILGYEDTEIYLKEYLIDKISADNNVNLKNCIFNDEFYKCTVSGTLLYGEENIYIPEQEREFHEWGGSWWYVTVEDSAGMRHTIFAYRKGEGAITGNTDVLVEGKSENTDICNGYGDINFLRCYGYDYLLYTQIDEVEDNSIIMDRPAGFYLSYEKIDFGEYGVKVDRALDYFRGKADGKITKLIIQVSENEDGTADLSVADGKGFFYIDYVEDITDSNGTYKNGTCMGDAYNVVCTHMDGSFSVEGTVGIAKNTGHRYYLYDVHRTENGELYISDMRIPTFFNAGDSTLGSVSVKCTLKESDGKNTKADTFECKINIEHLDKYEGNLIIKEMSSDDRVLSQKEYPADNSAGPVTVSAGVQYLIVEQNVQKEDGTTDVSRKVYTKDDPKIISFSFDEYGFGTKEEMEVIWSGE